MRLLENISMAKHPCAYCAYSGAMRQENRELRAHGAHGVWPHQTRHRISKHNEIWGGLGLGLAEMGQMGERRGRGGGYVVDSECGQPDAPMLEGLSVPE